MDNVIILNICVIFLVVSMLVIQKLNKLIEILEKMAENDERGQGVAVRRTEYSTSIEKPISKIGKIGKVAELPPEAIAPNLKKPPRPAGGFGSRVGDVKSDT
jgi:hypothetical protein